MKKKKCPQCKNLVSITAPTCLFCGRPNKFVTDNYVKKKWDQEYKKNKIYFFETVNSKKILFVSVIILTIMLIVFYK